MAQYVLTIKCRVQCVADSAEDAVDSFSANENFAFIDGEVIEVEAVSCDG